MFWQPGEHILWHYRFATWQEGQPEFVDPMTVVRDDERGLVAWLAPGTERLKSVLATGAELRSAPLAERFTQARARARGQWFGPGILLVAPTRVPWSVWLFWDEQWAFEGWYLNLEALHQRDGKRLFTSDHVLDVWVEADGTAQLKDDDELEAAVEQGRFTAEEGAAIRDNARAALASFRAREWPFGEPWPDWRPDPAWSRPTLPAHMAWDFDELGTP